MKPGLGKHKKRQARVGKTNTANKIARVVKTELDLAFHAQLGEVKRLRDDELAVHAETYRQSLRAARDAYEKERGETYKRYDERRDTILKRLGVEQEAQAA